MSIGKYLDQYYYGKTKVYVIAEIPQREGYRFKFLDSKAKEVKKVIKKI